MQLRNKFVMAPIKLGYCKRDGLVNSMHFDFYEERCTDLGAITFEPLYMDSRLRELPTQLGIDSDDKLPGLTRLVRSVKRGGAKTIAHLNHPGRMANPKISGNYFISSTDKPCENGGAVPIRMNANQMDEVIELFVRSSQRAEKAGFDFIELQLGHGYLLAQFISAEVNDRNDSFGGSLENRIRFPLQVVDAVRKAVTIPLIVRLSGSEMTAAGIQIDETITLGKILAARGIAALHISAGSVCTTPPWFFQHMFVPKGKTWELAARVQSQVEVPVIFVGQINTAWDVNNLEQVFNAQYIAVGRALIADPRFIKKLTTPEVNRIRPCLACSEGCLGGVKSGQGLHCVVNPLVGEVPIPLKKSKVSKRFAVIGSGLAGMEIAINLYDYGNSVTIYEKDRIGGQYNLASLPPGKSSLSRIIDYYEQELNLRNIKIHFQEATAQKILTENYDEVVVATGSVPMIPPIEGLKEYYWTEFLNDEQLPRNERILIIGGGLIGLEVASKLIEHENEVLIVDLLPELAKDMEAIERTLTLKKLKTRHVRFFLESRVDHINTDRVYLTGKHTQVLADIDKLVLATGMQSETGLYEELKDHLPSYLIGDARKVSKAQNAIREAYELAQQIG